ncbi:MAG TPA: hypothetical protein VMB19_08820 [Silvibacterium sp.]|nr:hypothetical protein [Silvibacterium sp.]
MKFLKTLVPILIAAAGLGCGYTKPATTPTSMPAIAQLTPNTATAGGPQFQLEVDGTNFAANAVINFNGIAQTTTTVSAGKIQTTVPASAIMNTGTVPVTVTNPGTTGLYGTPAVSSAPVNFTIN